MPLRSARDPSDRPRATAIDSRTPRCARGLALRKGPATQTPAGACLALIGLFVLFVALGCGGRGASSTATSAGQTSPLPAGTSGAAPTGGGASSQIRAAIEHVLASTNPALACGSAVTARYLRTTYGDQQGCIHAQAPGSAGRSVAISGIRIAAGTATASAVPSGGPSNGERITVDLVLSGGVWRIDSLRSNVPVGP